jgi:subtilisin family serine protease
LVLFFGLFAGLPPVFRTVVVNSLLTDQTNKISAELLNVSSARVIIEYENFSFGFANLTKTQISTLAEKLEVKHVYPDNVVSAQLKDSVPLIKDPTQWRQIEESYGSGANGTGIKIAILDTGIDEAHPDLNDLDDDPATDDPKVILEKDFTGCGHTYDDNGHGTHCASIAAGTGEASIYSYVGVAPGAWLLNGKVLDANGSGYESWIIAGIQWAVQNGANVISLSLGGFGSPDDPASQTVDWAVEHGVVVCVAAGNNGAIGVGSVLTPGLARKALTVGASCKNGSLASFSSYGPTGDYRIKPELLAPGVDITAARANGTSRGKIVNDYYTTLSGTSMATPHVAGAVALLLQIHPDWTPEQIHAALVETATSLTDRPVYMAGGGIANVCNAATTQALFTPATLNFGIGEILSLNATITTFSPQTFTFLAENVGATPNPVSGCTVTLTIQSRPEGAIFGAVYAASNITALHMPYFAVVEKNWTDLGLGTIKAITSGVVFARRFVIDGDVLYCGYFSVPARIDKISLANYTVLATLQLPQDKANSLAIHDGYLYVGTATIPAHIFKIDLSTFTVAADLTCSYHNAINAFSLAVCNGYLFASFWTFPAIVEKIDLATFTETGVLEYPEYPLAMGGLTLAAHDGRLYAGSWGLWGYGSVTPKTAVICEIDPSTLKIARSTALAENEQYATDLEFVNDTLIVALEGPNLLRPSSIAVVNLATFTETQHTILSPSDTQLYGLTTMNDRVYGVSCRTGIIVLNSALQKIGCLNFGDWILAITSYRDTLIVGSNGGNIYFVSAAAQEKLALTLTITATEGGTTNPTTHVYSAGSTVSVTATPNTGYRFSHWELDGNVVGYSPVTILMNANRTLKAYFYLTTRKLTITSTAGGTTDPAVGSYTCEYGGNATVTATPNANYRFNDWLLDGTERAGTTITVTMNANHDLQAVFTLRQFTLTINSTAGGTTEPAQGARAYDYGTNVTVTAAPNTNYRFEFWELDGSDAGSANPKTILMDDNHELKAYFSQIDHTLAVSATPGGTTTPKAGTYTYINGSAVEVSAVPNEGYYLAFWLLDGISAGNGNPLTVTMDANHALQPVFTQTGYRVTIEVVDGFNCPLPNATVYINGRRGTTGENGTLTVYLPAGSYLLIIFKGGYLPYLAILKITGNTTIKAVLPHFHRPALHRIFAPPILRLPFKKKGETAFWAQSRSRSTFLNSRARTWRGC